MGEYARSNTAIVNSFLWNTIDQYVSNLNVKLRSSGLRDDVMVMHFGEAVEYRSRDAIFAAPEHSYTRTLFAATPRIDVARIRARVSRKAARRA